MSAHGITPGMSIPIETGVFLRSFLALNSEDLKAGRPLNAGEHIQHARNDGLNAALVWPGRRDRQVSGGQGFDLFGGDCLRPLPIDDHGQQFAVHIDGPVTRAAVSADLDHGWTLIASSAFSTSERRNRIARPILKCGIYPATRR